MKRIRLALWMLVFAAAVGVPWQINAQPPAPEPVEQTPSTPEGPIYYRWRPVLRIGQDFTLRADDSVREVTVIFGNATIEGHVDRDVSVIFGSARLASTATIDGSLVVVGGSVSVEPGGRVRDDLAIVAGELEAAPGFSPGGQHIVIGSGVLGGRLEGLVPWITRGLFWGRPIVPDLAWVWGIVFVFFLVYLALNLVFHGPVHACARTLSKKPVTSFMTGLLVLLLTGPVCVLLALSVVGLAVVPLVICALFVAGMLGKVAVTRWIGMSVVHEESEESRLQSIRSFVIGFAVLCVAYMVPVLGFATVALVAVLGLGGAALAFLAGYRQENPLPPRRVPVESVPVVTAAATYPNGGPAPMNPDATSNDFTQAMPTPPVMAAHSPAVPTSLPIGSDLLAYPHAEFFHRLAAFVLDVILVAIVTQLLFPLRRLFNDEGFLLPLLAYHIGFWTWKATTVGGIICNLRLVRIDGSPLRFVDALVRGLSGIFSLAVLGLGGLWILKDPERQAWHDRIAGTYVVKVPRNWPI